MFEFKDVTEDIEIVEDNAQPTKSDESFKNIPNLSPNDEEDRNNISTPPFINSEKPTLNACPSKVAIRDKPSKNIPVLTTYFNKRTQKWHESSMASHPFVAVNLTKIDTFKDMNVKITLQIFT